ncbi:MAG: DUF3592 domain-containing protein [Candidatus Zixiibacteriota bacterium]
MKRLIYYAVCLVLVAVGAVLAAIEIETLLINREVTSWPTTTGIVVEAKVVGERAIRPRIVYQYRVDSVIYQGESSLNAPMFGGKRKKYDVAQELVRQYDVGHHVTVHFNPDSVSQSVIAPVITWAIYGRLAFGVTICMLGLAGMVGPIRRIVSG